MFQITLLSTTCSFGILIAHGLKRETRKRAASLRGSVSTCWGRPSWGFLATSGGKNEIYVQTLPKSESNSESNYSCVAAASDVSCLRAAAGFNHRRPERCCYRFDGRSPAGGDCDFGRTARHACSEHRFAWPVQCFRSYAGLL